jgi:hypothetical protein
MERALEYGNDPVRITDSILSCAPQLGHDMPIRLIMAPLHYRAAMHTRVYKAPSLGSGCGISTNRADVPREERKWYG